MNETTTHATRAGTALLAALLAAGCDFAEPTTENPNTVDQASVDQLFTAVQVTSYALTEGQLSRLAAMWTQQGSGVYAQFSARDVYEFDDGDGVSEWPMIYGPGGLVDIRNAIRQAEAAGRRPYAGILKIHEAYSIGTAASWWGDVPYSEAADPNILRPRLDDQAAVYAAVQALLAEAIEDLASSDDRAAGPGALDFNFGPSTTAGATQFARWTAVARTLQARFHMHMAEAGGQGRYQAALAAAQQGVQQTAHDWRTIHSNVAVEQNLWFMFTRDRPDHIVAGEYLVNLMNNGTPGFLDDDDPRLARYFLPARGEYQGTFRGSLPGLQADSADPESQASPIRTLPGSPAAPDASLPMVGCAENAGIAAEAAYRLGQEGVARTWLQRLLDCEEARWGVQLPDVNPGLGGEALRVEIGRQKYFALFLHQETWNDYKRTCLPAIMPVRGRRVPARIYYPEPERISNPNIPPTDQQPERNDNDPQPCRVGV